GPRFDCHRPVPGEVASCVAGRPSGVHSWSRHSVYLRELEPQIPYPFDQAVQGGLIVDPASQMCLIRTGGGHLQSFEGANDPRPEPATHDELVLGPLASRGLGPTEGALLCHDRNGSTVAGTGTPTLDSRATMNLRVARRTS